MLKLTVTCSPTESDVEAITDGVRAFNRLHTPGDSQPLCVFAHDEQGEAVGGLVGKTSGGWLQVALLSVSETHRGKSLGSQLLQAAEQEAEARGCTGATLDTFSFQAPGFYQKLGYRCFGVLHGIAGKHKRYYLQKPLASQAVPISFEQTDYHKLPMPLLLHADPSEQQIRTYLSSADCYVAHTDEKVVGACLVLPRGTKTYELMNIAVEPERQAQGIGSRLLQYAIGETQQKGAHKLCVGTGTFGYQLAFYQRAGFRVEGVEHNHFLDHYPEPIFENGIQHKDMLRLSLLF